MQNLEKSVSTLLNNKPAFCMLVIRSFLNFSPILWIRREERVPGISRNFEILKFFISIIILLTKSNLLAYTRRSLDHVIKKHNVN